MSSITISVDNSTDSFLPGDVVTGVITLNLISRTVIKGITVQCKGESRMAWSLFENVHFEEKAEYLDNCEAIFQEGSYGYNFSFQLPSVGLPASFVNQKGTIQYYVHAVARTKLFSRNIEEIFPFNVIGVVDLNAKGPVLQKPTEINQTKSFGCSGGSVGYSFILSKTGFVPGEFLCFHVDVFNNTNKDIKFLSLKIEQIAFTGKRLCFLKKKCVYNTFMNIRGPSISAWDTKKSWHVTEDDGVVIESLTPTRRRDIVQINYVVQIVLKIPNGGKLCGSIPILIGTVPFTNEGGVWLSPESGIRKIDSLPFH